MHEWERLAKARKRCFVLSFFTFAHISHWKTLLKWDPARDAETKHVISFSGVQLFLPHTVPSVAAAKQPNRSIISFLLSHSYFIKILQGLIWWFELFTVHDVNDRTLEMMSFLLISLMETHRVHLAHSNCSSYCASSENSFSFILGDVKSRIFPYLSDCYYRSRTTAQAVLCH